MLKVLGLMHSLDWEQSSLSLGGLVTGSFMFKNDNFLQEWDRSLQKKNPHKTENPILSWSTVHHLQTTQASLYQMNTDRCVCTWWLPLLDVLLLCWFFSRRAATLCSKVSRVWSCGSPPLKHTRKLLRESFTTCRSSTLPCRNNKIPLSVVKR